MSERKKGRCKVRTVYMVAVKRVEVGEEFEPFEDAANRLAFANVQGQALDWAETSDGEVVNMTLAPDEDKLVELIETTFAFAPEDGVDIGTRDLARNILKMFLCVDLRPAVALPEDRPYLALETDSPERWSEFATQHPKYKEGES